MKSRLARTTGIAGLVANVLLILFFALAQPWLPRKPARSGPGSGWPMPIGVAMVALGFTVQSGSWPQYTAFGRWRVGRGLRLARNADLAADVGAFHPEEKQ